MHERCRLTIIPFSGGGNGARALLAAIEIAPQLGGKPVGTAYVVLYVPFETILIALAHRTGSTSCRDEILASDTDMLARSGNIL
jgi:hypothetical protein